MSSNQKPLKEIIKLAQEYKEKGQLPLTAVFDLDSTLFDVSPRISNILKAFAEKEEIKKQYPEAAKQLIEQTPDSNDYGVKRTLMRIKFKSPGDDFIKKLVEFWKFKFFGSDHLNVDLPYPGAQAFVKELHGSGAKILYLTGRDIPRMLKGTVESLKAHGFPLEKDFSNLYLKPSSETSDSDFKKEFFLKLKKGPSEVWFFENEPKNIKLVLENCSHIKVVFVKTVHSENHPEPGVHIPRITGFL